MSTKYHDLQTKAGLVSIVSDGTTAHVTSTTNGNDQRPATVNGVPYTFWANLDRDASGAWKLQGDTPYLQWQSLSGTRADWLTGRNRTYYNSQLHNPARDKLVGWIIEALTAWAADNAQAMAERAVQTAKSDCERAGREWTEATAADIAAHEANERAREALAAAEARLALLGPLAVKS